MPRIWSRVEKGRIHNRPKTVKYHCINILHEHFNPCIVLSAIRGPMHAPSFEENDGKNIRVGDDYWIKLLFVVDDGYFQALSRYLLEKRGKKLNLEEFSHKLTEGMNHLRTRFYLS